MAFLRFTRDRRGYEHFSLVEPTANRRGKPRQRLLYWYRTPPNVRVGREPFDESVRRALEAQNPTIQFDWRKIVETPIPSVDTERWRERRRLEKAEKAARRGAADEDQLADGDESEPPDLAVAAAPAENNPVEGAAVSETNNAIRKRRRRRGRRGGQARATDPAGSPAPSSEGEQPRPAGDAETDTNPDPDGEV
jgi:hypothetical protein